MAMREEAKVIKVRGVVVPALWDEKGKAIAAALSTNKEEEYLIDQDATGSKIIDYIQCEVEASGVVTRNKDKKIITISTYEIIR